ncbi:MAG TPA: aromatic amino acid hydroxylase [Anaeromyxobacteraceae bacterium]|nr:aromatic amino acid hydroxylase [Anaeromyxobacteraceae bacterium]
MGTQSRSASPTPSQAALARLPPHLRRFVVAQDYDAYTARDHAVWRHILRRLVRHLAGRAHPAYLRGLEATGIGTERIPSLDEMNVKLARLGWSAVCVRGFIPPAVFTELQSIRVLAIAADVRTHEHIEYTPAPDIVHESAGHAPIIAEPEYAAFLERAGELGFRAIASREDEEVFEAIRGLSIVKEDPAASDAEVAAAEQRLADASSARRFTSESTRASRLYWWTAEYGLVGDLDAPKIYGAGLLSSIGESVHCLTDAVEKLPLTLACADREYDITRMQPQLFVARELGELPGLVDALAAQLAWKRGGDYGLSRALEARTVNHLRFEDGLEVSGVVRGVERGERPATSSIESALAVVGGPSMLSRVGRALAEPFDLPTVVAFGAPRPFEAGLLELELASGLVLSGRVRSGVASALCEMTELRARIGSRELAVPDHALVAVAEGLSSVAGGAADPGAWDRRFGAQVVESGGEARARAHKAEALHPALAAMYREVREQRESGRIDPERLEAIAAQARGFVDDWLLRTEVAELLTGESGFAEAPVAATY